MEGFSTLQDMTVPLGRFAQLALNSFGVHTISTSSWYDDEGVVERWHCKAGGLAALRRVSNKFWLVPTSCVRSYSISSDVCWFDEGYWLLTLRRLDLLDETLSEDDPFTPSPLCALDFGLLCSLLLAGVFSSIALCRCCPRDDFILFEWTHLQKAAPSVSQCVGCFICFGELTKPRLHKGKVK
jgi:hypothetical protein